MLTAYINFQKSLKVNQDIWNDITERNYLNWSLWNGTTQYLISDIIHMYQQLDLAILIAEETDSCEIDNSVPNGPLDKED